MNTININELKIQYDDTITDINRIAKIIELNQSLFADYKNTTIYLTNKKDYHQENTINVSAFDEFFDNRLKTFLNDKDFASSLEIPDLLPALYIQLLIRQQQEREMTLVPLNENITEDTLWFLISCKYFDKEKDFDKLSHFLKYRDNKETIFHWLKETQRFKTYNYLLEIASNFLKEYDFSFYNNIDKIVSKMTEKNLDYIISRPKSSFPMETLSTSKLEGLFLGFLEEIKAPKEWKEIYTTLKAENRIIYEEEEGNINNSQVFVDEDGIRKIKVSNDGTINTFINLVHEFTHYISYQKGIPLFSIIEFPPIYYERVAALYLINIGYDENTINEVVRDRNEGNLDIYKNLIELFIDICRFNNKGPIKMEDKVNLLRKTTEAAQQARSILEECFKENGKPLTELDFPVVQKETYEETVAKNCDTYISGIVQYGLLVINGYQYLIDSYLADSLLEKEDSNIPEKMIFITENLINFNIENATKYLGIEKAFEKKQKKKVHN